MHSCKTNAMTSIIRSNHKFTLLTMLLMKNITDFGNIRGDIKVVVLFKGEDRSEKLKEAPYT